MFPYTRVSAITEVDVASFNLTFKCSACALGVQQAAQLENSHGSMAWRWPHTTLVTRHIDGQNCENGQETGCRGHFGKGPDREQCAGKCPHVRVFGKQTPSGWGWRSRRALSHGHCASGIHVTVPPTDHRLSRNMKLRLYNLCICSTLTHTCEAWTWQKLCHKF